MSRYVVIEQPEPIRWFASVLKYSRPGLDRAYQAAWEANELCCQQTKEELFVDFQASGSDLPFAVFNNGRFVQEERASLVELVERRDSLRIAARANDLVADQQSNVLILSADDALRELARALLKPFPGPTRGFGPLYPRPARGEPVPLTNLLRSATNTLRHVSEWNDNPELRFPYGSQRPESEAIDTRDPRERERQQRDARAALENIKILQRVFGIGVNERITSMVSWKVVAMIDGQVGTSKPDYRRFEDAVITAAREIADAAGDDARERLDHELSLSASTR